GNSSRWRNMRPPCLERPQPGQRPTELNHSPLRPLSPAALCLSCAAVLASLFTGEVRYQTIQRLAHLGEVTERRRIGGRRRRELVKAALQSAGVPQKRSRLLSCLHHFLGISGGHGRHRPPSWW